jgi:pimeloyl-ACP methyl ester carboxylesterase
MGRIDPGHIEGVHVNALVNIPRPLQFMTGMVTFTRAERARMATFKHFRDEMMGYVEVQGTRPKTLSYGLTDSPVGQLAWIVEKFKEWTDPAVSLPEDAVGRDRLLTDVSIYWFTRTAGSSANLYWETRHSGELDKPKEKNEVPTAVAVSLAQDVTIRKWAEKENNIVRWTEFERGGHFAAMERPAALVADVRAFFGELR